MKFYLKALSICYLVGFVLHLFDLLDLRLKFSEMNSTWRASILFLFVADICAAVGLWKLKTWGIALFLLIAILQLVAYTGYRKFFGAQEFLIGFHVLTILLYMGIYWRQNHALGVTSK